MERRNPWEKFCSGENSTGMAQHTATHPHTTESRCLLQLKLLTAVTRADTHPTPPPPKVWQGCKSLQLSFQTLNTLAMWALQLCRNTQLQGREDLTHTSTVPGRCCLSCQTDWQQDLIKQNLLHSYKGCKCEFKHAQITAEQTQYF